MATSEIHIFWWGCDNHQWGTGCQAVEYVIGEGSPRGWWTLENVDDTDRVFCSEACVQAYRDAKWQARQSRHSGQDAGEMMGQITQQAGNGSRLAAIRDKRSTVTVKAD